MKWRISTQGYLRARGKHRFYLDRLTHSKQWTVVTWSSYRKHQVKDQRHIDALTRMYLLLKILNVKLIKKVQPISSQLLFYIGRQRQNTWKYDKIMCICDLVFLKTFTKDTRRFGLLVTFVVDSQKSKNRVTSCVNSYRLPYSVLGFKLYQNI